MFQKMQWYPRVDVKETADSLISLAKMPGLKEDDIEITVENNVLTLKGECKFEHKEEKENYHRVERQFGCFQRSFSLPGNVNSESVKAQYRDGVLEISFQKKEESKPKKIKIGLS
jgi:HSP20 family protein